MIGGIALDFVVRRLVVARRLFWTAAAAAGVVEQVAVNVVSQGVPRADIDNTLHKLY